MYWDGSAVIIAAEKSWQVQRTVRLVTPRFGGSLTHASTSYISVLGEFQKNGKISLAVTVPYNCSAMVVMPNGETHSIGNGWHSFEISFSFNY